MYLHHLYVPIIGLTQTLQSLAHPNPGSAASAIAQTATPPVYPGVSTRTIVYSTTTTSVTSADWISPRAITIIDKRTVTTLQPGPFPTTTPLPAKVTQWVVTSMTQETRIAWDISGTSRSMQTSFTTWVGTAPETFALFRPAPSDLPAGTGADALPCDACPASASAVGAERASPDQDCESRGLHTGCQGQCELRDGMFWCMQRWYKTRGQSPAMGRACWGGNWVYWQLLTPCRVGDYRLGCTACSGRNTSYGDVNWDGPGAEGGPWL